MYRNNLLVTYSPAKYERMLFIYFYGVGDHSNGFFNMKSISLDHHAQYLVIDRGENILNEMG